MQLSDSEIREIIRQEKRRKRRRQVMMRRAAILIVIILLLIIIIASAVSAHRKNKTDETSETVPAEPRGILFIDPGHGGSDPGSEGDGRYEKDDTLTFAAAVQTCLEDENLTVVMSRESDEFVERADRAKMANESGAGLMVSFHRNKSQGEGEGVEIFIPLADTKESRLLAEKIMAALVECGFDERSIRVGTLNSSAEDYEELSGLKMPACLVEVGFINSSDDNSLFDNNLNSNAYAVSEAISSAFRELYESKDVKDEEKSDPDEASESDE